MNEMSEAIELEMCIEVWLMECCRLVYDIDGVKRHHERFKKLYTVMTGKDP